MVLLVVGLGLTVPAHAQDTKSARGTVTAVGNDSITVKAADRELKLMVDTKTVLTASGAGTAERRADAAGKPGPRLADYVKTGDAVEVSYHETGGTMHAANIRRVTSPGSSGGSTSAERAETANGTVDSITGSTLVISGSAGSGGSFKQSYAIDATTKVIAMGASTAAAAKGGKVAISDFVAAGDQVTVSYHKAGAGLHADEVRVRSKAAKK
jgi:co-chaperonin GroES (HSP10)